jgi:hypothetical protein
VTTLTLPSRPALALEPTSIEDLGLEAGLVRDLALKMLFYRGRMTRSELVEEMHVSAPVVDEIMQGLSQDGLAAIVGGTTAGSHGYVYAASDKGQERARQALDRSGYVGPAPVPLAAYREQAAEQSVRQAAVTRSQVEDALSVFLVSHP